MSRQRTFPRWAFLGWALVRGIRSAHISGYWFLDEDESWCPSVDLVRFLDDGDPPVCVGFGSMAGRDPEKKTRLVLQALELAGVRGILVTGWGGLKAVDLPDSVLVLESAPHGWLFPRMSAVVHHGGAGTTAAALRAGRPSVICPFIADQTYWGRTLHELGVASEPIPQKKLTAENLSSAIRLVISDDGVRTRAEKLGSLIRREDGTGAVVTVMEWVLDSWERVV